MSDLYDRIIAANKRLRPHPFKTLPAGRPMVQTIFAVYSHDIDELVGQITRLTAERDNLRADLAAAKALLRAEARERELREALNRVLIGGNHLALLIGADHPLYTATHEEAMAHYRNSKNTYEIWCCWKTMMEAGNALDRIDAALKGDGDDNN